jgi:PAS domain S-box-containing protein
MKREQLLKDLKEIKEDISNIKSKNKITLDWVNENMEFKEGSEEALNHPEAVRITKLFTDTDHLARLVWDEKFRIFYANDAFLNLLGYKLHDVVGRYLFNEDGTSDFLTEDSIEDAKETINTNLKNGVRMIKGTKNRWKTKSGEIVDIDWQIGFNDSHTGIGSTQCIFMIK